MNWIPYLIDKSLYVKSILTSQKQNGIEKIHFRQLTPVLSRLLANAPQEAQEFLQHKKDTPAQCLLNWLASIGEIIKLDDGYYTIWSACNLELPSTKRQIGVRYVLDHKSQIITVTSKPDESKHILPITDYLYAPTLEDTLNQFQSFSEIDELDTIYRFTEYGRQQVTKNFTTDELYLAEKKQVFAHGGYKIHRFLAKFQKRWYIQQIADKDIWRVYYALNARAGRYFTYKLEKRLFFTEIELQIKLPYEESAMLSLIGMPKTFKDSKVFYILNEYLEDTVKILQRLKMKERS